MEAIIHYCFTHDYIGVSSLYNAHGYVDIVYIGLEMRCA